MLIHKFLLVGKLVLHNFKNHVEFLLVHTLEDIAIVRSHVEITFAFATFRIQWSTVVQTFYELFSLDFVNFQHKFKRGRVVQCYFNLESFMNVFFLFVERTLHFGKTIPLHI